MQKVRVRFAPSPTGALHIGGVRTALYNYLLARKTGGTMILRIEDTDQNRFVPGAEEYIIESLRWVGIQIDEGPVRQSDRKAIYKEHVDQLVNGGHAYYAFDTPEELDAQRKSNPSFQYDAKSRMGLNNSLSRSDYDLSKPHVIRFKVPEKNIDVTVKDLIRGEVTFNSSQVDDKVLMKSDGMPTYHLANVVDDHLMKISHVIRGEEWLPSAPLHVLLYRYFGWENTMPAFAHLPLLLKPDGNGKLSKRDADKMGFPIFPLTWKDPNTNETAIGYREAGYLPEAIINFLVLLGWNPGTEQELFTMEELIEAFSLEHIHKAGAKFDILKAQWFNQQYIKRNKERMVNVLEKKLEQESKVASLEKIKQVVDVLSDRVTFPKDFWEQGKFFFETPAAAVELNDDQKRFFETLFLDTQNTQPKLASDFKALIEATATKVGVKSGQMMKPLRILVTGTTTGPDLMITMEILGSDEVLKRIKR
ncbi:MAG TPA: glutamate--tRNA ligase [Cyclobacteriaceae bacterium]